MSRLRSLVVPTTILSGHKVFDGGPLVKLRIAHDIELNVDASSLKLCLNREGHFISGADRYGRLVHDDHGRGEQFPDLFRNV